MLVAILVCSPATAAGRSASQNSAPLNLASYAATLDRCSAQLAALGNDPAGIPAFRRSLPEAWEVRAGSESFSVSTGWLDSALADAQHDPESAAYHLREARRRLEFLRQQAVALESPQAVASAAARADIDTIFQGREFRGLAGPTPLELWWQRINHWLAMKLAAFLHRLHLGGLTGNLLAYTVIALAIILLALWAWRNLAARSLEAALRIEPGLPVRDSRGWAREALAAADRGEYREAIHCAYWTAVTRLETIGAFPRDRSRTPRELLRLLDSRPEQKEPFREVALSFERVWYGFRGPTAADWAATRAQLEKMGCLGLSIPATASS